MPTFARIDGTNTVTDIFTLDNGECLDASGTHSSTIGAAMCEQKKAGTPPKRFESAGNDELGTGAGIDIGGLAGQ